MRPTPKDQTTYLNVYTDINRALTSQSSEDAARKRKKIAQDIVATMREYPGARVYPVEEVILFSGRKWLSAQTQSELATAVKSMSYVRVGGAMSCSRNLETAQLFVEGSLSYIMLRVIVPVGHDGQLPAGILNACNPREEEYIVEPGTRFIACAQHGNTVTIHYAGTDRDMPDHPTNMIHLVDMQVSEGNLQSSFHLQGVGCCARCGGAM